MEENKTISIFKYFVRPLIICITVIIALIKLDEIATNVIDSANTVVVRTNYTIVTNVRIITNDQDVFGKFPYTGGK